MKTLGQVRSKSSASTWLMEIPLAAMHTNLLIDEQFKIRSPNREITQQLGLQRFNRHWSLKSLNHHLNFWKCSPTVEYIAVLWELIFGQNNMVGRASIGAKCLASSWSFTRRLPWFEHYIAQFCYAALNFGKRSYHFFSTCWICGYTCKTPIITHIALE